MCLYDGRLYLFWQIWVFYLPTTAMGCWAFGLGCDLAVILGRRGDNALRILFSHLNKVIQVHHLCG